MSEVKDPVNLLTVDIQKGTEKITGVYEREDLEIWIKRATRENSEFILRWGLLEIEEE